MAVLEGISQQEFFSTEIAVVGMSGRFPGADNLAMFWDNLVSNIESISHFSKEELIADGESEELLENPNYVRAKGILNDIKLFDANFFSFNAYDAKLTDPQQRLFLECAWEALESAGYVPEKFGGLIGVYASMADSLYLQNNLLKNRELLQSFDWLQARMATSLTTLSTQLSYRLNLKGPSINVTTACSSSLVAIAMACKGLIDYDCDMAIAGAAAISVPQKRGYIFQEGGIDSPDGHCKAFDADAKGTVFSNGLGVVILKRLQDAIDDGDFIHAVIKGWSINNDGASKVGFTAPSVEGQARCVASALAFANIDSDSISYIETHGTGTALGDPIEINALTEAFRVRTDKKDFCAIGSVKTNIGHTDIAAGMASFIKVAMALENKVIPATLHYTQPNPQIDFSNTPFYVNAQLKNWGVESLPRRAGVNASGFGGTNAFLVLEEYTQLMQKSPSRPYQLLLFSAKTKTALEKATQDLQHILEKDKQYDLANIAFTLQVGRADFNYRRMLVCNDKQDAFSVLEHFPSDRVVTKNHKSGYVPKIVFMFSGQGSQYIGMAKGLYDSELEFAKWIDYCCDYLDAQTKKSIYSLIFSSPDGNIEQNDTLIVQPALFIIEYSLAKFWMDLGIRPDAMIGHSIGEYVAACLAGVFTLEDALKIVCHRGKLMAKTSPGIMLAVEMNENGLIKFLGDENISIAAINSLTSCVISGAVNLIDKLEEKFKQEDVLTCRLKTSNAFHSHLMDSILDDFRAVFEEINLHAPNIPFVSNVTGSWIEDEEAINPDYWVNHIRQTVKFLQGLQVLVQDNYNIYLEIGPGRILTNFVNQLIKKNPEICIQNSLPTFKDTILSQECFLLALGQLWLYGVEIDWKNFYKHEKRNRIPLPTYPFERQHYWIAPNTSQHELISRQKQSYDQWFYEPSWLRSSLQPSDVISGDIISKPHCWIILSDPQVMNDTICTILADHNQLIIKVKSGDHFIEVSSNDYVINITHKEDYQSLVKAIAKVTDLPLCLINLLPLTPEHDMADFNLAEVHATIYRCFYSLLFFTQAIIEEHYDKPVNVLIVTNEMSSILGNESIYPAKATVTGPCRVIPQEHPLFKMRVVDVMLSDVLDGHKRLSICHQLIADTIGIQNNYNDNIIGYRGDFRWVQIFRPLKVMADFKLKLGMRETYLLTGGLGGISLTLAKHIALSAKNPRLVLMFRSHFPEEVEWKAWLLTHPKTDAISKKILHLQEIKDLGTEIMTLQTDITNFDQLKSAINKIKSHFGAINGVIHAAGIAGGGLAQLKTIEMARKVFAPKIDGTYLLTHLLRDEPLNFFLLCSSISSIIGELSQIDYCAANACLDAFAYSNVLKNGKSCISVNWNTWREVGMAVETERPTDITYFDRNNDINPEEGTRIFSDVLNNGYRQAIISSVELNSFIELINSNKEAETPSQGLIGRQDILGDDDNYLSPKNDIENDLAIIWQDILGINKVGVLDDFYTLGGHSLMALRLLAKIEKKFNMTMSLQMLQEARNIQKVAAMIAAAVIKKGESSSSIIIPIRSNGQKPPLFCFHPVGGTVFCYMDLAKNLMFDCPIYGLNDPSIECGKLIYNSLEDMASSYIKAIQQIQPHGPYLLAGLSFGATLAVEVARQLQDIHEKVRPLIFFDGWAKFSDKQHMEELFTEAMSRLYGNSDKKFVELSWARMRLLLNYKIPMIKKDNVILFKAKELLPEYQEIDHAYNYWDKHVKENIEVHLVSGNHETILDEPNVKELSEKLNEVLIKIIG